MSSKLQINTPADALSMGRIIAASRLFGDGVKSDEAGAVVALMCYDEGMSLLQFSRTYNMLEAKPSMKADAMLAKFMELGGKYELIERTATRAAIKAWREEGKPHEFSLTMDEVKAAGYCFTKSKELKRNWQSVPRNMLWARVVSDAVRTLDPRVNAGIYTPEEVEDFEDRIEKLERTDPKPIRAPIAISDPLKSATTTQTFDPFVSEKPTPAQDFSTVPIGPKAGTPWMEIPRELLVKMVANPGPLSPGHLAAAKDALDRMPF
jgi:hypothetical protein